MEARDAFLFLKNSGSSTCILRESWWVFFLMWHPYALSSCLMLPCILRELVCLFFSYSSVVISQKPFQRSTILTSVQLKVALGCAGTAPVGCSRSWPYAGVGLAESWVCREWRRPV